MVMLERVEWIFFDVGSTLINERKVYEHRMRDMAEATNRAFEQIYDMAISFYKENKKGDLEVAKLLGLPKLKWYFDEEVLYEDAIRCLEQLSKRYKIGVIANQALGTVERLQQHGILQFIDLVIASAEEGVAKPDPRIYQIALERSGCKPENAVMIGDRIDNDIVPAKRMGIKTIWIKQGFGGLWNICKEDEAPDNTVNDLVELLELFKL